MSMYSKIISWHPSTFREKCVKQSCRFHRGLQLSCWELSLNHLVSWWKNGLKLRGKNKIFSILRKFSKLRKFQILKPNLQYLISWWKSFTFWHVLMNFEPWHLILTKKSKFDFSVYSWLLISWLKIHLSIHWTWALFWAMSFGQNDAIGLLRSCLKPIDHFLGQKSEIALSQSKP